MFYVSLLVLLYLQAKQHYQITTAHEQQQTINNKQPINYHIQLQYHVLVVQYLLHHIHYYIIRLSKIILVMVKIYIFKYYVKYYTKTLLKTQFLLSILLLLVNIFLYLKYRKIFTLIIQHWSCHLSYKWYIKVLKDLFSIMIQPIKM